MTTWDTIPEPVGESRWRFPSAGELPEGDLVTIRPGACA